ncbi:unnamed protein product [Protopolystoma xenopodis]|uniref:Choline/carnitine acyltransferase domain-containing protein n=1 Tax=Protopolystoma xenopodis TaxID=117903 RepID=A0A3S5CQJ6_9PLAT|nr:unnamed protein product [Protopolystoma xenopodis]
MVCSFDLASVLSTSSTATAQRSLLLAAIRQHNAYTQDAMAGQAIDRHLMGLRLISREYGIESPFLDDPFFFNDQTYDKVVHWTLSTSQVRR